MALSMGWIGDYFAESTVYFLLYSNICDGFGEDLFVLVIFSFVLVRMAFFVVLSVKSFQQDTVPSFSLSLVI